MNNTFPHPSVLTITTKAVCQAVKLKCLEAFSTNTVDQTRLSEQSDLGSRCLPLYINKSILFRQLFAADDFRRRHFQGHFAGTFRFNNVLEKLVHDGNASYMGLSHMGSCLLTAFQCFRMPFVTSRATNGNRKRCF